MYMYIECTHTRTCTYCSCTWAVSNPIDVRMFLYVETLSPSPRQSGGEVDWLPAAIKCMLIFSLFLGLRECGSIEMSRLKSRGWIDSTFYCEFLAKAVTIVLNNCMCTPSVRHCCTQLRYLWRLCFLEGLSREQLSCRHLHHLRQLTNSSRLATVLQSYMYVAVCFVKNVSEYRVSTMIPPPPPRLGLRPSTCMSIIFLWSIDCLNVIYFHLFVSFCRLCTGRSLSGE